MELVREAETGILVPRLPQHFPFVITETKDRGRALFSGREILPDETVLTDSAILLGPASSTVCIVCCSGGAIKLNSCPGCRHPLCEDCSSSSSHPPEEYTALSRAGYSRDIYNIILPIRFGLLQERDRDMFEWLLQYMDHNEERNAGCKVMKASTEKMARIVADSLPGVNESLAKKMIGILFTNCFEFKLTNIEARALYPLVSLINHSCIPNLRHTNLLKQVSGPGLDGGEIVVMRLEGQRTIPKHTELTIRYTDYMMSHLQRRRFLAEQWHFTCQCPRCRDPTEFGTMTSSLPCTQCQGGVLLPSQTPCNSWCCTTCSHLAKEEEVEEEEKRLLALANTLPQPYNIRTCLQQLHSLSAILHTNHFIMMGLKQRFLFAFSINMKKIRDLEPQQRTKLSPLFLAQEKYCRQLLTYHEILDPGSSGLKTKLLLELRKTLASKCLPLHPYRHPCIIYISSPQVLLIQSRILTDSPTVSREELQDKLEELRSLGSIVCTRVPL